MGTGPEADDPEAVAAGPAATAGGPSTELSLPPWLRDVRHLTSSPSLAWGGVLCHTASDRRPRRPDVDTRGLRHEQGSVDHIGHVGQVVHVSDRPGIKRVHTHGDVVTPRRWGWGRGWSVDHPTGSGERGARHEKTSHSGQASSHEQRPVTGMRPLAVLSHRGSPIVADRTRRSLREGAPVMTRGETSTPVLYLNLDGTVRHGRDELGRFVNGPNDVVIVPT
jgi:hypothetical protein